MQEQHPSDLEVIDIRYQYVGVSHTRAHRQHYVGASDIYPGKIAILPPEYRWLLDIGNNDLLDGPELSQEWKDFNDTIFHYIDTAMGEGLYQLLNPNNPYGFIIVSYKVKATPIKPPHLSTLEDMAKKAMEEYHAGLTKILDPDTL